MMHHKLLFEKEVKSPNENDSKSKILVRRAPFAMRHAPEKFDKARFLNKVFGKQIFS